VAHMAPPAVVQGLQERGINASVSRIASTRLDMQERGLDSLVRAAVHYYNTEDEVARFLTALEEVTRY